MSGEKTGAVKNWTASQREAIEARGVNLLVSAGAGSGKTAVMIERIISLLREGADLSKMLICTFTRTAAADMRRKLDEALYDKTEKQLAAAKKKLPLAEICTLDSWCAHVIKNRFFISDLSPDFSVLDENEEKALKAEVCDRLITEECNSGDYVFAELYEIMLSRRSHAKLCEAVLKVYDYAVAQPYPEKWLALTPQKTDARYREILVAPLSAEAQNLYCRAQNLLAALGAAGFAADYNALTEAMAAIKEFGECCVETPRLNGKPEFKQLHEDYKELISEYRAIYAKKQEILSAEKMPPHGASDPYCRKIAELALKLRAKYGEVKRSRGKADYSDLEHQTLKILNDPDYGAQLVKEYTHIFVDEYQDISPLQEELLSKFSAEMFFVGDVKQSIYGFRMCRPDFFTAKREAYGRGEGKTVALNTNFRSGTAITDAVNSVFDNVMKSGFGGTDYAADRFTAGRSFRGEVKAFLLERCERRTELCPSVYSVKNADAEVDADIIKEARAVTAHIIKILDEHTDGDEAISYGDIAVLVRSRSAFTDALLGLLRAQSIPVTFVSSAESADSFATVSALISMLKLINNTRDDVSLAAVLLSPMFGKFTPAELNELRRDDARSFCDCIYGGREDVSPQISAKLNAFITMLNGFINAAERSTVAELAGIITGECDCFNYATCCGGEREAAALDAFTEYLAAAQPNDLYGAMSTIERVGAPKLKVGDGGRAVKIMTIHASKGLEFKYVILPHLDKRFNFNDVVGTVICDEHEGVVLRAYDVAAREAKRSPRFAVCSAALKRNITEEEMRMLYVAMTRAQNGLYLFSYPPKTERETEDEISYIDWLYPYLFNNASVCDAAAPAESGAPVMREPIPEIVDALKRNFEANGRVERTSSPVKITVTQAAHSDDEPQTRPWYGEDAAARGTAYHKLMQWADFDSPDAYEELRVKFPREAENADREQIVLAVKNVNGFIGGRRYVREKQFVYNAADSSDPSSAVLVQGVIDLMVFNRDGSVEIVDYKTGAFDSVKNNAAYVKQLDMYAAAAEKVLKVKVSATYLYSFSGGSFIRIK